MKLDYCYKLNKGYDISLDQSYFAEEFVPWYTNRISSKQKSFQELQLHHYSWPDVRKHLKSHNNFHKKLRSTVDAITHNISTRILGEINLKDIDNFVFIGASKTAKGFSWHKDDYHIIAVNIIGHTIWEFENGVTIEMQEGDVLYSPKGLMHRVKNVTGYRLTVSNIYR